MSAYDYCRDKVALPGSSLCYSVLFVAPALRASLTALHALAEELREVVEECSDEDVARAKLGWWADEMRRACAGHARTCMRPWSKCPSKTKSLNAAAGRWRRWNRPSCAP